MSWIFGIVGDTNLLNKSHLNFPKDIKLKHQTSKVLIYSGGLDETAICEAITETSGFVVLGIGIKSRHNKFGFISAEDWKNIISEDQVSTKKLNGHYLVVEYEEGSIKIFNDRLGIRDLFFYKSDTSIIFSTRLDWVTKFQSNSEINLKEFSSAWLTSTQISHGCFIKGINRLGPFGKVEINVEKSSLNIQHSSWEPEWSKSYTSSDAIKCLEDLILFPSRERRNTALSLSGGLDSRTLLSILLKNNSEYVSSHAFGDASNQDVSMAKTIASKLSFNLEIIPIKENTASNILTSLYHFIPTTGFLLSLSDLLVIPSHAALFENNKVIIDGAYGEILRREFLNRILFLGKDAVTQKRPEKFFMLLKKNHGSFFKREINNILYESTLEKINSAFNSMPDYKSIGLANWLDYFIVKYKAPNIAALGQTSLDQIAVAFMPFIQPDLIEIGLCVPIEKRKNSKINRKVIRKYDKRLEQFPLIKNMISYPYSSTSISMRIITGIKRKLFQKSQNENEVCSIDYLKDFIMDRINSSEVKNFDLYDSQKLKIVTDSYFNGNMNYKDELESWLMFDIWRELILQKN